MFYIFTPLILLLAMFVLFVIIAIVRYGNQFCSVHRDPVVYSNYDDEYIEQVSYA